MIIKKITASIMAAVLLTAAILVSASASDVPYRTFNVEGYVFKYKSKISDSESSLSVGPAGDPTLHYYTSRITATYIYKNPST